MKSIFSILTLAMFMFACTTTDTATEVPSKTSENPPADMQGNVIEGGVNVDTLSGDTTIMESDGYKTTVTNNKGDTTIVDNPGIFGDTMPNGKPNKPKQ